MVCLWPVSILSLSTVFAPPQPIRKYSWELLNIHRCQFFTIILFASFYKLLFVFTSHKTECSMELKWNCNPICIFSTFILFFFANLIQVILRIVVSSSCFDTAVYFCPFNLTTLNDSCWHKCKLMHRIMPGCWRPLGIATCCKTG